MKYIIDEKNLRFFIRHTIQSYPLLESVPGHIVEEKSREWLDAWHPGEFDRVDTTDAFNMLATRNMELFEEYKEEVI
jgi:hypothetical protein